MTKFSRYIALGDSMTEGMCDDMVNGQYRGWADRVAETLAKELHGFSYLNLAVRGKLLNQVINDQIPVAKRFIEGQETLVSFHAGANDVLRPNYKPDLAFSQYEKGVKELAATGATLMLFTVIEKATGKGKTAELWESRFKDFNINVRRVANEVGAILIEWNEALFLSDRRFLAIDRLHLNQEGHYRVAQGVLEKLDQPFDHAWRIPLSPPSQKSWFIDFVEDLRWFLGFALPWVWRRIRGRSSGDGRSAKHSQPIMLS